MHAQRLHDPRPIDSAPLRAEIVPAPEPGPGELLLRVTACGVCRTDLQLCEGDLPARRLPLTPGHQIVGVVEAVGPGVSDWAPGARAGVAWLAESCGRCRFCRSHRENLCLQARFTGWDRDGGYAELATVRAGFALPLPPSLDDAGFNDLHAAPLLCGGVIGYRALRASAIEPGGRLGLYGFGASARLAIQVARSWDCDIYVCTRNPADRARARELGAVWVGGPDDTPPVPLDAAVSFAPAGDVVLAALRALDRGATVAINAIHLDRIPQFSYDHLWWERRLVSVANFTRRDAHEFLQLAAAIPIRTEPVPYPLSDANRALQDLNHGRIDGAAVLLPPGHPPPDPSPGARPR